MSRIDSQLRSFSLVPLERDGFSRDNIAYLVMRGTQAFSVTSEISMLHALDRRDPLPQTNYGVKIPLLTLVVDFP